METILPVRQSRLSQLRHTLVSILNNLWRPFRLTPLLGWLVGALLAVAIEQLAGNGLARGLGMFKLPALFGFTIALKTPALIPSAFLYVLVIYLLPLGIIARLGAGFANRLSAWLLRFPLLVSALVHVGLLYATLQLWTGLSEYRLLIAKLTMIAVIVTLSLNVVNGYLGEFSCSHPGFMAIGAYTSSVFTVLLFVDENRFGAPLLPPEIGPFLFPVSLILAGAMASISSLLVAIPSFRTRGDYLAIISLAFMFIVKSLFENLELVGGPRGLSNQPDYANLPTIFFWTILSIWVINNFVRSILGKALNAIRDGELAASAMSVDTRRTKMIGFMFAAFWAGISGGLFAHVIRFINPDTFGIRKLAEVLAMVYLGGLNSVAGSVVGAVGFNLMSEALRPLEILKWIIIPVLLILLMVFRPTGLISFTDLNIERLLQPKRTVR